MGSPATLESLQAQLAELTAEVQRLRETIPTQLVDLDGVAAFLRVSPRTVRRLVANREIPYRRVGRHLRFDLAQLRPPKAA